MRLKNTQKPLPEIARELNVDAVIAGAVLQSGTADPYYGAAYRRRDRAPPLERRYASVTSATCWRFRARSPARSRGK